VNYSLFLGFLDEAADRSLLLDSRGARKTETLFVESITNRAKEAGYEPLYSLRETEKDGKPSAYLIYMNSVDETEAALKLVGSLAHWRRLCGLKWFVEGSEAMGHEGLIQWRDDMKLRDASRAKEQLMLAATAGSVPAATTLLKESTKKAVGRPARQKDPKQEQILSLHKAIMNKERK
jgi:hypothetical protein